MNDRKTDLARWRSDAERCVSLFQSRYGPDSPFTGIAERWRNALVADPPDGDVLAAMARDAERIRASRDIDIVVFAFCNDIQRVYRALWAHHLGAADIDG